MRSASYSETLKVHKYQVTGLVVEATEAEPLALQGKRRTGRSNIHLAAVAGLAILSLSCAQSALAPRPANLGKGKAKIHTKCP